MGKFCLSLYNCLIPYSFWKSTPPPPLIHFGRPIIYIYLKLCFSCINFTVISDLQQNWVESVWDWHTPLILSSCCCFNYCFYILNNSPLSDICFADFCPAYSLCSHYLNIIFDREDFYFNEVQISNGFLHESWVFELYLKSHCHPQGCPCFLLCHLLWVVSFLMLHLGLLSTFELILVKGVMSRCRSILLHAAVLFF